MKGMRICSLNKWNRSSVFLTSARYSNTSTKNTHTSTIDAHECLQRGKEYVHTNQLNSAIREFKRAQLAFDETKESELIAKADTLFELGDALIQISDRKLISSGFIHKRYLYSSDTYKQAQSQFLQALDLYPKNKHLAKKRALCWQRAASLQINYIDDLHESLQYIRNGLEELPMVPEAWEGYIQVINTLLLSEIEEKRENDFTLDRNAIAELSDIQVEVFLKYVPEKLQQYISEVILNTLRITGTYWNPQLQSKYIKYFQQYCLSTKQIYEGNFIIAQTKYKAMENQACMAWYYGDSGTFWDPHKLPAFCESFFDTKYDCTDLGEVEATVALQKSAELSPSDNFTIKHFLSKIYITRKIRKDETKTLLDDCVTLSQDIGNVSMRGIAFSQLGFYYTVWGKYSMAYRAFRKAHAIFSNSRSHTAAVFEMYCGFIELAKITNDHELTAQFYEETISLVKGDDIVSDLDWQIILGYAIWLVEKEEYDRSLNYIWEAIDNLKDVLYSNTILLSDPVGPWPCISYLITKISAAQPESEDFITKRFNNELKALESYFPDANAQILEHKENIEHKKYEFPKLYQLRGTNK